MASTRVPPVLIAVIVALGIGVMLWAFFGDDGPDDAGTVAAQGGQALPGVAPVRPEGEEPASAAAPARAPAGDGGAESQWRPHGDRVGLPRRPPALAP